MLPILALTSPLLFLAHSPSLLTPNSSLSVCPTSPSRLYASSSPLSTRNLLRLPIRTLTTHPARSDDRNSIRSTLRRILVAWIRNSALGVRRRAFSSSRIRIGEVSNLAQLARRVNRSADRTFFPLHFSFFGTDTLPAHTLPNLMSEFQDTLPHPLPSGSKLSPRWVLKVRSDVPRLLCRLPLKIPPKLTLASSSLTISRIPIDPQYTVLIRDRGVVADKGYILFAEAT